MPTWTSKFQIALQADGVNALRPLSELILADPNTYQFFEYRSVVGRNGLGVEVPMGFPYALLTWTELPQQDIDILNRYAGQFVIVRAETNEGVTARAYTVFSGYAQRLQLGAPPRRIAFDGQDGLRQRRSVSWEWSQLVEYVPE